MPARRERLRVECPRCLERKAHQQMIVTHPTPGPLDVERPEAIPEPHWRYRCPACRFSEIHMALLRT